MKIDNNINIKQGGTQMLKVMQGGIQVWPETTPPTPGDYFTIEAISACTLPIKNGGTLYYSSDCENWTSVTGNTSINMSAGQKIYFKRTISSRTTLIFGEDNYIAPYDVKIKTYGNSMSLLYGDNFAGKTTLPCEWALEKLFYNCTGLYDSEGLELPALFARNTCYSYMFHQCIYMSKFTSPKCIKLAPACYQSMYDGCWSMSTQPLIPFDPQYPDAEKACFQHMFLNCQFEHPQPILEYNLAESCYAGMYRGNRQLRNSPVLPKENIPYAAYATMFFQCNNLNLITCYANPLTLGVEDEWVTGVANEGTFIARAGTKQFWEDDLPEGWTIIENQE